MAGSLIAAIRIFGMLQIPQGSAALDGRNGREVIRRGRGTDRPFQGPCVPWIIAGLFSLEIRNDEICNEHKNCDCLNERADRNDEIQSVPTAPRFVGVDPARHPENARNMHHVKCEMKSDEEQPEMPFAETLTQHAASHFWIPIIKSGEEREQNSAHDYIMKVRYNEIREAELPVERRGGHHDAGQSGDEKLK